MNKDTVDFIKECIKKDIITGNSAVKVVEYIKLKKRASDIWKWARYYFPDKFSSDFIDFHKYLFDIRHEELSSTLGPRSHGKTIISCFLVPLYLALHDDKYRHFLNVQNTSTKATNVNLSIKTELETNEKLIKDYGELIGDKSTEKQFVLKNGVIFSAVGAGESIRGINYNNIRPDYIVVDDLYSEDDIGQLQRIKKINNWFWSSLYPARANDKRCAIHVQGTAIDKSDIMHELKDSAKYRKFQAITNEAKKETLWFPYEKLMENKLRMGTLIFSREYQNELRDDSTSIIKESWIKYYDGRIPEEEKIKAIVLGVDPAISESKTADYTGKCIMAITENYNYYIMDVRNDRMSFNSNIEDIKRLHKEYGFKEVRIESIAAFQAFGQELKRTTRLPVKSIKSVKGKLIRKENCSHLFENGKVFINSTIAKERREELVYQLINNSPNNDDISDSVIICLESPRNTGVSAIF